MRLLLINPKLPDSFWSFRWAVNAILPGKRAVNPPLGLATLAALTPAHWQVAIVDENIETVPLAPDADIVGIGGMGVQVARQRELLAYYRARGHHVVVGGAAASLEPERYQGLVDTVVAGEAEYIWPRFCQDFEAGCPGTLYWETGTVDLADSPVPRFDLLNMKKYSNATLQYSRGCPFTCEFCDIIVMFGRKPRTKSPEQVERELDRLRALGVHTVFFVDDNMVGHKRRAKALLRFLIAYQQAHRHAFSFGTEVSLDLAQDDELLDLFRVANFGWVFVGIESPDPESLKETGKTQNLREDPLVSVRRIYSRGIDVLAGFIVGFDNDTPETFEMQRRFITEAGIQSAMVGLLSALPRTPLHARMIRDGRLRVTEDEYDNTSLHSNILHPSIDDGQMAALYRTLYHRLLSDQGIAQRIRNKARYLVSPVYGGGYPLRQSLAIVARLLVRGILPGGLRRIRCFLWSLFPFRPARFPLVISDWIVGLSMRAFARDNLWNRHGEGEDGILDRAQAVLARHLRQGEVRVNRQTRFAIPDLIISLGAGLNRRFFASAARHLCRLLDQSCIRLTLKATDLPDTYLPQFERFLSRLAGHGDRVFIELGTALRARMTIDLSRFNVVLAPVPGEVAR
ncbi:MAG: hypothetical protein RLZZ501_810 [Pseudomonadota bacterium]|jgi:radical SAM superfamily enzyme YgiQ (UPF0313 family)